VEKLYYSSPLIFKYFTNLDLLYIGYEPELEPEPEMSEPAKNSLTRAGAEPHKNDAAL
jgi:hypothetical protein